MDNNGQQSAVLHASLMPFFVNLIAMMIVFSYFLQSFGFFFFLFNIAISKVGHIKGITYSRSYEIRNIFIITISWKIWYIWHHNLKNKINYVNVFYIAISKNKMHQISNIICLLFFTIAIHVHDHEKDEKDYLKSTSITSFSHFFVSARSRFWRCVYFIHIIVFLFFIFEVLEICVFHIVE